MAVKSNHVWMLGMSLCGAAACSSGDRPDTLGGVMGLLPDVLIADGSTSDSEAGSDAVTGDGTVIIDDSGDAVVVGDNPPPPDGTVVDGETPDGGGMDATTDPDAFTPDVPPIDSVCVAPSVACGTDCINTQVDIANCGACGTRCPPGSNSTTSCVMGACTLTCATMFDNCNMMAGDGCETELGRDTMNCGRCGTVCPGGSNAMASCESGNCALTCTTGFLNCNAATPAGAADGCEIDGRTDLDNCGSCGRVCRVTNGSATCSESMCHIVCNPGYFEQRDMCVPIPPPRLRSPMAGSAVTSRRPLFEVSGSGDTNGVLIEICSDRACNTVVAQTLFSSAMPATSFSVSPSTDLPGGVLYWRGRGVINRTNVGLTASNVWQLVVPTGHSAAIATDWGASLDVDGDGFNDVLIGAPDASGAYLYRGSAGGVAPSPSVTLMQAAGGYGRVVAGIGDPNGDGFTDVAVAATTAGNVFIYNGGPMGLASTASAMLGGTAGSGFGASVASAGDINNDGYGDLLVGSPTGNIVSVFVGSSGGLISTGPGTLRPLAGITGYGSSVAGGGDIDGDGRNDVLVGAGESNAAFVHLGVAGSSMTMGMTLAPTPVRIATPSGAMGFGSSIGCAGDVNGDGYLDVIVGAPGSATAYVFHGGMRGLSTAPVATLTGGTGFGFTVSSAGDVNNDGYGDVLVGERSGTPGVVFLGGMTGISTTAYGRLNAPTGSTATTVTVGTAGDVNGDGRTDFLVGNPATASVGVHLTGATLTSTASSTLSSGAGSGFGTSLFGAWR